LILLDWGILLIVVAQVGKYPKNVENFASEREEGKREMKISKWRKAANTGL
jgi:hypothetical protein